MKKQFNFIASIILMCTLNASAQTNTFPSTGAAGIGTTTPNASSLLDITSTNKGVLVPRMTQSQRNAIVSPATGLLIYQTNNTPGFYYYTGTAWTVLKPTNATKKLNNLTAPTAINVELLPDTNNSIDLGSPSQAWKNIYASGSYFIGSNKVIDVSGSENTFIGNTGNTTNTGSGNIATGKDALMNNTTGYYNTATGVWALRNNTTGYQNTATGRQALATNSTGYWNTATGLAALTANSIGNKNTATGLSALQNNTAASENTAIGVSALANQSYNPGSAWISYNTAVGYEALLLNQPTSTTNGIDNTALGHSALRSNTTGIENTACGKNALYSNTTGGANTATGKEALYSNSTGFWNTANGESALYSNTSGYENTAIGLSALYNNTTGFHNTAIGAGALVFNTTGERNTAIGQNTLYLNTTGSDNTSIGRASLYSNTIGVNNTALGRGALFSNSTGSSNTAIGMTALYSNTTAALNTAIGSGALQSQSFNAGFGWASSNTAVGCSTLFSNQPTAGTNGVSNTAVGNYSMLQNTIGAYNTASGVSSMRNSIGQSYNTAHGYQALYYNTGSYNTSIGANSGNANGTLPSNFTCIGYNAGNLGNNNNTIEIGNPSVLWIGGQTGWSVYSDKRIKDNVQNNVPGLSFITKLNPVTYKLNIHKQSEICGINDTNEWEGKYDIEKITQTGFLAQEVEQAAKECNYDFNGVLAPYGNAKLYSVQYSAFVMPLVKAVQEQQEMIEELMSEIENLKLNISSSKTEVRNLLPEESVSQSAILYQNIPNPFNKSSVIKYSLPSKFFQAALKIYASNGVEIKSYPITQRGNGEIMVEGNTLSAGIYSYTLLVDNAATDVKQMIVTQ